MLCMNFRHDKLESKSIFKTLKFFYHDKLASKSMFKTLKICMLCMMCIVLLYHPLKTYDVIGCHFKMFVFLKNYLSSFTNGNTVTRRCINKLCVYVHYIFIVFCLDKQLNTPE